MKTAVCCALWAAVAVVVLSSGGFQCPSTGDFPINDGACDNSFFKCGAAGQRAALFNCSASLIFDAESGRCLHSIHVAACGGSTTQVPVTTTRQSAPPAFAFKCRGRRDGDYSDPHEPCSANFVKCSGGQASFFTCPGDTKYDAVSGECLEEAYVKLCGGEITTRSPLATSTVADDDRFDCVGLPDGLYPDPWEACSYLFFACAGEKARAIECPKGLYYDVDSQRCAEAEFVTGCGGQATPTPVITTRAPQADDTRFSCAELAPGTYEDPRAESQGKFGVCSPLYIECAGAAFASVRYCQGGLVYDIGQDRCDYPESTPSCTGRSDEEPETTPIPQPKLAPKGFCAAKGEGNFALEHYGCSADYVQCPPEGRGTINSCPQDTYYDAEIDQCGFYDNVPECSGNPRTTSTQRPFQTTPADPFAQEYCAKKTDGNYPYTEACSSKFITCSSGIASVFACPGETVFNPTENACLEPSASAGCEEFAEPENECLGRVNGFYPDAENCRRYVFCAYQQATELWCKTNEVFNPLVHRCVPSDGASCDIADMRPIFSCEGRTSGYYTLPGDCMNFYYCDESLDAYALTCEAGYAFNTVEDKCVPEAELVNCAPPRIPDPVMQNFCLRAQDGVFASPIDCTVGIICLQNVAIRLECTTEQPMFDSFTRQCTNRISAEAQCVPAETAVFVELGTPIGK